MKNKVTKIGSLVAMASIVGYIEMLLPIPFPVVGMKLGLANVVVLLTLYLYGGKSACTVSFLRILIVGMLFGTGISILYSFFGAVCSLCSMILLQKKTNLSAITVSIVGSLFHCIGQIVVAILLVKQVAMITYLPALMLMGMVTGGLIGVLVREVLKRGIKQYDE